MFGWLVDSSDFMTRNHCGAWTPTLAAIYKVSSLLIAISYLAIPTCVVILWHRRRGMIVHPWMLLCFASFILTCGLTHFADVAVFYWAPYRLYTSIIVLCAFFSVLTAALLPHVILQILKLPSRSYVHKLNNDLQAKSLELELRAREAELKNADLVKQLEQLHWTLKTQDRSVKQQQAIQQTIELLRSITG